MTTAPDAAVLRRISDLVRTEHDLRTQLTDGAISSEEERSRLAQIETALDQCWDLLRQRQARREAGQDPAAAQVRSAAEVEGYRQ
ncbi:conserved hypothetical protein [Beutenbergia cavernae DSM 12333]|uniref:DUF2630 domain-containing protein n=1 Tax=Beutenbergia cavernae (strain ATCC BAA-8 / DSM 12333 / CCUG 43141 / JCM 11478 / NBRC 16432 / NCIMB 13614 / HKI 0122) TaxID=471853 RepID=C5C5Q4_BEUC1|nr:DUF2630 family protein [Beutenbergia cavernae]ACQ80245.1 conserved hypothetical protein [Beutenbergia cavernae DSM 12333]